MLAFGSRAQLKLSQLSVFKQLNKMKCYGPLSRCFGAFSIMGDNVGEGVSFSSMIQEKSLSTATKWSLRLRLFCQLLCPRLQMD